MVNKPVIYSLLLLLCGLVSSAQTVTLDYYFNHEVHNAGGETKRFHYRWDEKTNPGFSIWGDIFTKQGARLDTLDKASTAQNLARSDIYIIVDPDSKKESPAPNYIQNNDVKQIAAWVKKGGVLVLMANDSANVELLHFNKLAAKFGFHFGDDMQNHVIDDKHFDDGAIATWDNPIFKTARKLFLKDVCGISYSGKNVKPVLKSKNGVAIAVITRYGRGTVFAVGDPWLYNEYVNGRLPAGFDNDKAAAELTKWLIGQIPAKK
ncbi:DUF4350 domain-containing protein [Mucilaginibacter glaciei]|uniref:DUF4350 domain-containing protein n=1 Tax=Mucilaginibacter glaciei TaxID=2772109 RepID=A0A926NWQ1_9SPHI|nr:DUF4350 domain-containing protein [Mucilaginibacter glaciei]MBD1393223.1 DUF4350 domain-containing protein [Mucilaginibacter glaciei]